MKLAFHSVPQIPEKMFRFETKTRFAILQNDRGLLSIGKLRKELNHCERTCRSYIFGEIAKY